MFQSAGGLLSRRSARWNVSLSQWAPLGELPEGEVTSIAAGGTDVFAGGRTPQGGGWVVRLAPAGPEYAMAGLDSWTDYRVSARLTLPQQGAAGIAFRWQNESAHFAPLFRPEGGDTPSG